jgi:hypothetical protein
VYTGEGASRDIDPPLARVTVAEIILGVLAITLEYLSLSETVTAMAAPAVADEGGESIDDLETSALPALTVKEEVDTALESIVAVIVYAAAVLNTVDTLYTPLLCDTHEADSISALVKVLAVPQVRVTPVIAVPPLEYVTVTGVLRPVTIGLL